MAASDAMRAEQLPGTVTTEFLTCQVEHATSPVGSADEARAELDGFRSALGRFAAEHGAIAAGTGTPFGTGEATTVSPSARYARIAEWLGDISGGHQVNGLHVHTEIADEEERIRALNRLRPWLPVLLALSGNAPFWHGRETGYQSWRSVLLRRLPTMGCPPVFADATHYRESVDRLVRLGAAPDIASLAWAARASDRYPTVEVRVFDAQLTTDDTLLVATLTRALLVSAPAPAPIDTDAIDAALWMAAREGLEADLLNPRTGGVEPATGILPLLMETVSDALQDAGDQAFVEDRLRRVRTDGTGAQRQLRAHAAGGTEGLRALFGADEVIPA
ncbi:carboxylate-amine ligase [Microbacterium tumbae]